MQQMELNNQQNAYKIVLKELFKREKFLSTNIIPINKERYHIIESFEDNIMIMFKSEVFFNFGEKFKELGYKGVGDSINCEDLKKCAANNVKRIFRIDPQGRIYVIPFAYFNENSIKWINKEGKEIKSISIHEWKKFNPE